MATAKRVAGRLAGAAAALGEFFREAHGQEAEALLRQAEAERRVLR